MAISTISDRSKPAKEKRRTGKWKSASVCGRVGRETTPQTPYNETQVMFRIEKALSH